MLTELFCDSANIVSVVDLTDTDSADLSITWKLKTLDGEQLATGSATSQTNGLYKFTINKSDAEKMEHLKSYILELDDDSIGYGQTFKVKAVWNQD